MKCFSSTTNYGFSTQFQNLTKWPGGKSFDSDNGNKKKNVERLFFQLLLFYSKSTN